MTYPSQQTGLLAFQARTIPGPRVYLAAAYWSLTTVATIGFGDLTPVTDAERAVLLFMELTGVLFFGILLSSITSLLQVRCTTSLLAMRLFVTLHSLWSWLHLQGLGDSLWKYLPVLLDAQQHALHQTGCGCL